MSLKTTAVAALLALGLAPNARAAEPKYIPAPPRPGATAAPPFSAAVVVGDTVYLSGNTDGGAAMGGTTADAARRVMEGMKRNAEAAGVTLDDLVSVQVFSSNLDDYAVFNEVYRSYFKGPLPARAYLGAARLLGDSHFEIMGIAVRKAK